MSSPILRFRCISHTLLDSSGSGGGELNFAPLAKPNFPRSGSQKFLWTKISSCFFLNRQRHSAAVGSLLYSITIHGLIRAQTLTVYDDAVVLVKAVILALSLKRTHPAIGVISCRRRSRPLLSPGVVTYSLVSR